MNDFKPAKVCTCDHVHEPNDGHKCWWCGLGAEDDGLAGLIDEVVTARMSGVRREDIQRAVDAGIARAAAIARGGA